MPTSSAFTALDWIVLVLYLFATSAIGAWLGRGQKNAKDYFVAGGSIPWWAVLFSIVATETSALTFIGVPALAYGGDIAFIQAFIPLGVFFSLQRFFVRGILAGSVKG